jgi:hypothetical protein
MVCRKSKYKLVLAQPFMKNVHGYDEKSSKDIQQHFICHFIFKRNLINELRMKSNSRSYTFYKHYKVQGLQIAEILYLPYGNECVAICKTFWLKIFIRVCKLRMQKIIEKQKRMKNIKYLMQREYK